jgi:hypothetical protein
MNDLEDGKNIGKPTRGGWGRVVKGGGDADHVTITNEKSEEGLGFHITSDDGAVGTRDYFDNDGNHLRTE